MKLHGCNCGIVKYADGHYEFQSRERVIDIASDNYGFALALSNTDYMDLFDDIHFTDHLAVYGEWCGGNVQKGVAISGLPKMWVIFAVKVDGVYKRIEDFTHLQINRQNIYNITQFEHYSIDIDFNQPEVAQNKMVEITQQVEASCPVGRFFGKDGVGEGVVWEHINSAERYIFKVKGEKHSVTKVKKLASINIEELNGIREFVEYAVTENRLQQGLTKMVEMGKTIEPSTTGDYIRWVFNDVIKEEQDTIIKNQIDVKKLGSEVSKKAREFWMKELNKIIS